MKKPLLLAALVLFARLSMAKPPAKIPILVDTDIGTDIDDAFALALVARSPEFDLLGVTTVSGDTEARARLAAKLLWEAGLRRVPVAAGEPGKPLPIEQARWAKGFSRPQLIRQKAARFIITTINRRPGQVTIIAIGPLTNIGAALKADPGIVRKIKRIVLMGGSIAHGYGRDLTPAAEYNIASDPAAAQIVFNSGVPILMVPLDVTAMLQLDRAGRHQVFTELTPMTNALALLYFLWNQETPTLFDPMAVAMVIDPRFCQTKPLPVYVDSNGFTRVMTVVAGKPPNVTVALKTNPENFFNFYLSRVAPPQAGAEASKKTAP
jgi:inosine-uridine nucleoside N-ribohydrolase